MAGSDNRDISDQELISCLHDQFTRLRHPETINSVPLNSVLRIKQIGV